MHAAVEQVFGTAAKDCQNVGTVLAALHCTQHVNHLAA